MKTLFSLKSRLYFLFVVMTLCGAVAPTATQNCGCLEPCCLIQIAHAQTNNFVPTQTYIGTSGTDLNAYTGPGSVAYARNGAFSSNTAALTGAGAIRTTLTTGVSSVYVTTTTAPSADTTSQVDIKNLGGAGTADIIGVGARWDPTADTGYFFDYRASIASLILYKHVTGTSTSLATPVPYVLQSGTMTGLRLVVQGQYLAGYFGTQYIMGATDSSITAAGRPSVFLQGTSGTTQTDTSGLQLTNLSATTVLSPSQVLGVTSTAIHISPGNWVGDTGRAGSTYRKTIYAGAYISAYWTNPNNAAIPLLDLKNATAGSTIAYSVNGQLIDNITVPTSGSIPLLAAEAPGPQVVYVFMRSLPQSNRWNLSNAFEFDDFKIDSAATPGTAPTYSKWVIIPTDSTGEGIQAAGGVGLDSNVQCWTYYLGQALLAKGIDYCVFCCGYSGWLRPGDTGGDVPGWYFVSGSSGGTGGTYSDTNSRWNKICAPGGTVVSLLDSNNHISAYGSTGQEPVGLVTTYGINEAQYYSTYSTSDTQASVNQFITAFRAAAPAAYFIDIVPSGIYSTTVVPQGPSYATAIKAGVTAYQSANTSDSKTALLDYGSSLSELMISILNRNTDGIHPNAIGQSNLGSLFTPPVVGLVTSTTVPFTSRTPSRGR